MRPAEAAPWRRSAIARANPERDELPPRNTHSACLAANSRPVDDDPAWIAGQVTYPCVLKPLRLSGSRGVIRANNADEFIAAFHRLRRMLIAEGNAAYETSFLVVDFIPGAVPAA